MVPMRNAFSGDFDAFFLTITIPPMEHSKPIEAKAKGKNIRLDCAPSSDNKTADMVDAIAMVAIIEPQYDSKISEPIPATSPTLSPTLSAITPGFRGSSSGIPASILPTKSAPTSALFVKMPPPTRENKATTDAPIAKP